MNDVVFVLTYWSYITGDTKVLGVYSTPEVANDAMMINVNDDVTIDNLVEGDIYENNEATTLCEDGSVAYHYIIKSYRIKEEYE